MLLLVLVDLADISVDLKERKGSGGMTNMLFLPWSQVRGT
jgi:hypothetical protein